MKATLCIDAAIGETRRCLLDETGHAFRLDFDRWSERGRRALLDEIWWGRATGRLAGRGWFVDLGVDPHGVLETRAAITEGAMVPVRIKSEAWADKGPVLSLADMSPSAPKPERVGRHAAAVADPFLAGVEVVRNIEGPGARERIGFAIEEATSAGVGIAGGGQLSIHQTPALTVIDVDAGERVAVNPARFDAELNLAAADEAARQVSLRGLGGLMAVDFVSMKEREDQAKVVERFRAGLAARLDRASKVLPISALGLCEASVARRQRPVADALAAISPAEQEALTALRLMEAEAFGCTSIGAWVSLEAAAWMDRDAIGWKKAFGDRFRMTISIHPQDRPPGPPAVKGQGGRE